MHKISFRDPKICDRDIPGRGELSTIFVSRVFEEFVSRKQSLAQRKKHGGECRMGFELFIKFCVALRQKNAVPCIKVKICSYIVYTTKRNQKSGTYYQ